MTFLLAYSYKKALNIAMENEVESFQWHEIAQHYPEKITRIDRSTTAALDALVNEFRRAAGDATTHSYEEQMAILEYLNSTQVAKAIEENSATLSFRGHGLYFGRSAEHPETFDDIDSISGRIGGLCVAELMSYFDLVNRKKKVIKPMLAVALDGYMLHSLNEGHVHYKSGTVIIPIMDQDLCITREIYG